MKLFSSKIFKYFCILISIPFILTIILIAYLYLRQDVIVYKALNAYNESISGEITIQGSHVALFENFPFISIDLEHAKLFKDKSKLESSEIIHLEDLHAGFNLWDIIKGNYTIKAIQLDRGHIDLTQNKEGFIDIVEMFASDSSATDSSSVLDFALDKISIKDVEVSLIREIDNRKFVVEFDHIQAKFKSKKEFMLVKLETAFLGSIYKDSVPSLLYKKHFSLKTELRYEDVNDKIVVSPTQFTFEHIFLGIEGYLELEGEKNIDLKLEGSQDNFNLFIAFAPAELGEALRAYENQGKIYVRGHVLGSMKDGKMPAINGEFGCENGFFKNQNNNKKLDEIEFSGTFTNGEKRDLSTMKFVLNNLSAQPEAGIFDAKLVVENFNEPDIDLNLKSNFNLDFLIKFINMEDEIKNPKGFVGITMNFHDIIDLAHPEKSLEKLNESYYTELDVRDLNFELKSFPLPIKHVNIHADVNGNKLTLSEFKGNVGNSNVEIQGVIDDVPAILHQRNSIVSSQFSIRAEHIDIHELTFDAKKKKAAVDEKIDQMKLDVSFYCLAKDLWNLDKLPKGEFVIENMAAKFQNYPHFISDVSAKIIIEEKDLSIKRFKGKIDESDFLFFGKMENYQYFIKPTEKARSEAKIFFKSKLLKLDNLLTYKDENYLPEMIKRESFSDVKLKAKIGMRLEGDKIAGTMVELSELDLTTSMHEKRFTDLAGKIFFRNGNVRVKNLKGQLGNSDFDVSLNYFIGKNDSLKRRENELEFYSNNFDLNEILAIKYNAETGKQEVKELEDTVAFKVTDIPFMDFKVVADIKHFVYQDYKLDRLKGTIQMKKDSTIEFTRFGCDIGAGKIRLTGKLDAKDSTNLVFTPRLWIKNLDLDQTLLRFKNFGQDYIISDNLSGLLSAKIRGTVWMNPNFTPKMESADLTLDVKIVDGELRNYKPLKEFSSFFGDKNLNRIKFDTLDNLFTLKNEQVFIPWMTINSTIGFLEVAGEQSLKGAMDMEYYVKIPLKLVTSVAYQKLFKRRQEEVDPEKEDEIQFQGEKKIPYIHIKLAGTPEKMSFSLSKDKREKKKA